MWSRQVIFRYSLLQLPGLVMLILILILLRQLTGIPSWTLWTFTLLWIIKDVLFFPFLWRAYEKNIPNSVIGSTGVAVDRLSPSGYVRLNGELWRARVIEGNSAVEKGESVSVRDLDGLTLVVQYHEEE